MDKKIYIIGGLLAVLLIAFVIFILTRGNDKKETTGTNNKIVIWNSFESEENFSQALTQYKAENKDLEIEYVKKDPSKYETDSINAFAAGNGPDIWVIPNNWLAKHHNKLVTLTESTLDAKKKKTNQAVFEDTFLAAAAQDNIIGNNVFGFPLFMDSLVLFDNPTLRFQKVRDYFNANPNADTGSLSQALGKAPETWEELGDQINRFGQNAIALGDAGTVERSSDILTALMLQYGAQMTSDNKSQALFQTPTNLFGGAAYPGNKALSFYISFAQKGDPNYTWPATQNAYQAFRNGNLLMMIDYSQKQIDLKKDTKNSFNISKMPQFKDTENPVDLAYYQTMTVPKSSQNQDKAWDLIRFLAMGQGQTKYLAEAQLPSALKAETTNSQDQINIQNRAAQSWYNPDPAKVEEIFKNVISQARAGQNPQTLLEGAAAEITTLLGGLQ